MKTIVLNERQGLQVGFNDWEKANCPTITTVGIVDGEFSHRIKNSLIKVESVKAVDSLISELQEFGKSLQKYEEGKCFGRRKTCEKQKKNTPDLMYKLQLPPWYSEKKLKNLNKKEGRNRRKKLIRIIISCQPN